MLFNVLTSGLLYCFDIGLYIGGLTVKTFTHGNVLLSSSAVKAACTNEIVLKNILFMYVCMHWYRPLLKLCSDGAIRVWDGTVPKDVGSCVKSLFALFCLI